MITVLIAENEEKVQRILAEMLNKAGNANIDIIKQEDVVKIMKKEELKTLVSLEDKVIELEDSLFNEHKGKLYKAVLEKIEKPLIEHILEKTEGNQFKAARILGMNRNTLHTKIKKLGISAAKWKET